MRAALLESLAVVRVEGEPLVCPACSVRCVTPGKLARHACDEDERRKTHQDDDDQDEEEDAMTNGKGTAVEDVDAREKVEGAAEPSPRTFETDTVPAPKAAKAGPPRKPRPKPASAPQPAAERPARKSRPKPSSAPRPRAVDALDAIVAARTALAPLAPSAALELLAASLKNGGDHGPPS